MLGKQKAGQRSAWLTLLSMKAIFLDGGRPCLRASSSSMTRTGEGAWSVLPRNGNAGLSWRLAGGGGGEWGIYQISQPTPSVNPGSAPATTTTGRSIAEKYLTSDGTSLLPTGLFVLSFK